MSRHFGAPKPRSLKNQSLNSGPRKKGREDNKLPRGNGVNITSREPRCGREESTPRPAPLRHWKRILSRTIVGFSHCRIVSVAAGVTFYAILAIFPGIAAMISLYGLFADTGSTSSQPSNLSGPLPGAAAEIIRGELTHLVAQKTSTLGTNPTSPTEGVGRRQAAEILGMQLQRSALQGMSAHATSRLFRAVIFGGG